MFRSQIVSYTHLRPSNDTCFTFRELANSLCLCIEATWQRLSRHESTILGRVNSKYTSGVGTSLERRVDCQLDDPSPPQPNPASNLPHYL